MFLSIIVLSVFGHCLARPSEELGVHNYEQVVRNCPEEQQWIDGICRDVGNSNEVNPNNVITVPPNCPPGQEWINGQCRDIWRNPSVSNPYEVNPSNMITARPNCPPGQQWINGQCRDIWRNPSVLLSENSDVYNMVTVPPNCLPGQELVNGQCRDIWRGGDLAKSKVFQRILENAWAEHIRNSRQVEDDNNLEASDSNVTDDRLRNIINIPNQCPEGYKPDALGICRKQL